MQWAGALGLGVAALVVAVGCASAPSASGSPASSPSDRSRPARANPPTSDAIEGAPRVDLDQHRDALTRFKGELAAGSTSDDVCWNAGLAGYLAAEFDEAARLWEQCLRAKPDDRALLERLVQAHQARGDRAARDRYRSRLVELYRRAVADDARGAALYVRDQVGVAGAAVQVFERLERAEVDAPLYIFAVYSPPPPDSTEPAYLLVLRPSLEATRQAIDADRIRPSERVYVLERTMGTEPGDPLAQFYELPPYDAVRARAIDEITVLERAAPLDP